MKNIPYSLQHVKNRLSVISLQISGVLLLALFAFPVFPLPVTNIIFICFAVFTVLSWVLNSKPGIWKSFKKNIFLTLPFVPYLIEYILYFNNPVAGFELEKKLLFFTAPLIFSFHTSVIKLPDWKIYIRTFTVSMIVLSAYSLVILITNNILFTSSYYEGDSSTLRIKFEDISALHPTYYGFFTTISILWIIFDFKNLSKRLQWIFGFSAMVLIFMDFLIAAKMSLIILILGAFFILYKTTSRKKILLITYGTIFAILASLVFLIPSLRERIIEMKDIVNSGKWVYNSVTERKLIFNCSEGIFLNHFWFGIGCRNAQFTLDICYRIINFYPGFIKNYNSHNQFLTMGINYGIFDVLLFLGSIIFVIRKERKNFFAIILIASIILIMLTESILERQMGGYFFVLFMLLLYNMKETELSSIPTKQIS